MRRGWFVLAGAIVVGSVALALLPASIARAPGPREIGAAPVHVASPAPASIATPSPRKPPPPVRPAPRPARVDPVLNALSAGVEDRALVVDVASLRDTRLARMVIACLDESDRRDLARIRRDVRWDPVTSVDRFAASDRVIVMEGRFAGARWQKLQDDLTVERRGGRIIYRRENGEQFAPVGDNLLVVGRDAEALDDALARLDGRVKATPLGDSSADLWGRTRASDLLEPLSLPPEVRGPLAEMLDEARLTAGIRVHFGDDSARVALNIDAPLSATSLVTEALGAALDAARGLAAAEPDAATTAALLSGVRVDTGGDGVDLALSLDADTIARLLGPCAREVP